MKNQIYSKINSLIGSQLKIDAGDCKLINRIFLEPYMAEYHKVSVLADNTKMHSIKIPFNKFKKDFNKLSFQEFSKCIKLINSSKIRMDIEESSIVTDIISILKINEDKEEITIFVLDEVYKIIKNIENESTKNTLKILGHFRSIYSQRLYESFRKWNGGKKSHMYTVEELKVLMCVQQKYPRYADFNRKCIKVAVKEINESGYMDIKVQEIKMGKKVKFLIFTIIDKLDTDNIIFT